MDDLEIEIASFAHFAENVFESHAADQILDGSTRHRGEGQRQLLVDRMDSLLEKVKEESRVQEIQSTDSKAADASSRLVTKGLTKMVGFDDYLLQLMDILTGNQSSRKIISIVGMGGIGKTTLARNAYENLLIKQHFIVRARTTISQEYDINEILLQLLGGKGESPSDESTGDELGEQLYKRLLGRRYLIILDDMWSVEVWDEIRFYFPDNDNESRIVITTRNTDVYTYLSSSSSLKIKVDLLNDDDSWKLFCATTFGEEEYPLDLVEIGKKIVEQCRGLPLSIVVIGGHLKKSLRVKEEWEIIAGNMISLLDSGEEPCLIILSLSYTSLTDSSKTVFSLHGGFWGR